MTGRTYYYQVVATNDTTSSKPSDPVQVTDAAADITAVDDTPDTGVIYSVLHGKTLTIAAPDLLANDIDPNTDPTPSIASFTNRRTLKTWTDAENDIHGTSIIPRTCVRPQAKSRDGIAATVIGLDRNLP